MRSYFAERLNLTAVILNGIGAVSEADAEAQLRRVVADLDQGGDDLIVTMALLVQEKERHRVERAAEIAWARMAIALAFAEYLNMAEIARLPEAARPFDYRVYNPRPYGDRGPRFILPLKGE